MSQAKARFKQADITRALRAARAAGLQPSGYRITISGDISVTFDNDRTQADEKINKWDEEF